MKIVALPDLHGDIDHLARIADDLAKADLVLLVGDLTNGGSPVAAARVMTAACQCNPSILAVPGNWDNREVAAYLMQGGISLHRRSVVIDQIAFMGVGASLRSVFATPSEITESDFLVFLQEAAAGHGPAMPKILVCHQPPIHTLTDKTWSSLHVGSQAVRDFIQATQPLVCFTGHIHEGIGIDTIGSMTIVNPGPLSNGRYAYAEITHQGIVALEIRRTN